MLTDELLDQDGSLEAPEAATARLPAMAGGFYRLVCFGILETLMYCDSEGWSSRAKILLNRICADLSELMSELEGSGKEHRRSVRASYYVGGIIPKRDRSRSKAGAKKKASKKTGARRSKTRAAA